MINQTQITVNEPVHEILVLNSGKTYQPGSMAFHAQLNLAYNL